MSSACLSDAQTCKNDTRDPSWESNREKQLFFKDPYFELPNKPIPVLRLQTQFSNIEQWQQKLNELHIMDKVLVKMYTFLDIWSPWISTISNKKT